MAQAFVLRSSDFHGFQQVVGRGADPFLKILKLTRSYWSPLLGRHWSADVLKKKLKLRGIRKNLVGKISTHWIHVALSATFFAFGPARSDRKVIAPPTAITTMAIFQASRLPLPPA